MQRIVRILFVPLAGAFILVWLLLFFAGRQDLSLEELKPKYANAASRFLDIDGMPAHYRDEGNAADTLPLVLVHGTGASLHTWDGWVDSLKSERRLVRFDLPAYGLTGPNPSRDYSLDFYTGFVLRILDSLGLEKVILGGNSLGGQIAWGTASRAPERVAALILVDAAGYPVESESRPLAFRLAGWPLVRQLFRSVTPRSIVEKSVLNVYADKSKVTPRLVDRYYELALRAGNRQAFLDRLAGGGGDPERYRKIATITAPTLILWGRQDRLIPVVAADRFHADLPNDTLVILDGLGHVPMEEDPARTIAVVKSFLSGLK